MHPLDHPYAGQMPPKTRFLQFVRVRDPEDFINLICLIRVGRRGEKFKLDQKLGKFRGRLFFVTYLG